LQIEYEDSWVHKLKQHPVEGSSLSVIFPQILDQEDPQNSSKFLDTQEFYITISRISKKHQKNERSPKLLKSPVWRDFGDRMTRHDFFHVDEVVAVRKR
jgi:hypothetical protein